MKADIMNLLKLMIELSTWIPIGQGLGPAKQTRFIKWPNIMNPSWPVLKQMI
jgi:hypothetical protein